MIVMRKYNVTVKVGGEKVQHVVTAKSVDQIAEKIKRAYGGKAKVSEATPFVIPYERVAK
jgi:uncharacterized Fe-S center protein